MRRILLVALLLVPLAVWGISFRHLKTNTEGFPEQTYTSLLALDDQGKPLPGLTAKDFKISLDSSAVDTLTSITTYEKSGQNLSIILCVDISGSMKGGPLQSVKTALIKYIESKKDKDEIAIISISDGPKLEQAFTTDKDALVGTIKGLQTKGNYTALYYGVNYALGIMQDKAKNQGRFMILFSDGKNDSTLPESERYRQQDVIDSAKLQQVPIFTVGYTTRSAESLEALDRIARGTNGSYFESPSVQEIQTNVDLAAQQIRGSYILGYPVFEVAGDGKTHELSVTLLKNGKDSGFYFSQDVKVPPNKSALPRSTGQGEGVRGAAGLPLWLILALAGAALGIALGVFFFLRGRRKRLQKLALPQADLGQIPVFDRPTEFGGITQPDEVSPDEGLPSQDTRTEPGTPEPAAPDVYPGEPYPQPSRERTIILTPGSGTQMMPGLRGGLKMEVLIGAQQGETFNIGREGATIGRAAGNSIMLADSLVSSRHARVTWQDGSFYLEDLGSLNGIYVDGQRVSRSLIENGTTFKIGSNEGSFSLT